MTGTVWSVLAVEHSSDSVWRALLRSLAEVSDLDPDVVGRGEQQLLIEQTDSLDAVASDDPVPATIDHDRRAGTVDLRHLPDMPAGLRGEFELVSDGDEVTTIRIGVTTDAWWGGAAARVARVGFLRKAVAGETEQRMHAVAREFVDLAVTADDETLRDLVRHGTPTTRRLAAERRERLLREGGQG